MNIMSWVSVSVLVCTWAFGAQALAQPSYRVVVRDGDPAPGAPGYALANVTAGRIDQQGRIAFMADMIAPGEPARQGIWVGWPHELELVVKVGDEAPGAWVNATFEAFHSLILVDGDLLFVAHSSSTLNGLWLKRWHDQVEAVGLSRSVERTQIAYSPPDLVAYETSSGAELWAGPATHPVRLIGLYAASPWNPHGFVEWFDRAMLDGQGNVAVSLRLESLGPEIRVGAPPNLTLVRWDFWDVFYELYGMNRSGSLAFVDHYTHAGPYIDVLVGPPGSLVPVATNTQIMPGTAAKLDSVRSMTAPDEQGRVALAADLHGPGVTPGTRRGMWFGDQNGMALVARQGDPAPGLASEVILLNGPERLILNNNGQFAFRAWAARPGSATMSGYWLSDAEGHLWPLALTNTIFRVGAAEYRMITSSETPAEGPDRGRGVSLTDAGEMVLTLQLEGTGGAVVIVQLDGAGGCYANCDGSTIAPILNVDDFVCFINRFAAGDPWANCDGSTTEPVLNINDFTCFVNQFAAGCP